MTYPCISPLTIHFTKFGSCLQIHWAVVLLLICIQPVNFTAKFWVKILMSSIKKNLWPTKSYPTKLNDMSVYDTLLLYLTASYNVFVCSVLSRICLLFYVNCTKKKMTVMLWPKNKNSFIPGFQLFIVDLSANTY